MRPYSVSPRLNDQMVGPKPTKYRVTFMPKRLAVSMCPASCRLTEIRMASANSDDPEQIRHQAPFADAPRSISRALGPRPRLGGEHVLDGTWFGEVGRLRQHPLDGVHDAQERQPTGVKAATHSSLAAL